MDKMEAAFEGSAHQRVLRMIRRAWNQDHTMSTELWCGNIIDDVLFHFLTFFFVAIH